MAHEVEQMFSVIETPWHRLGRIVQAAPTTEEAIRLAGLDWTVSEHPIYRKSELVDPSQALVPIPSHKAIVRDSDGANLGIVGKEYTPLQNKDAFKFFDPFLQAGECQFETAGSLRGGRTIWALAKINRDPLVITKGDEVLKFLLLSNGHDGTMAVRVGFTPIRVVCANTLAMSVSSGQSRLIRLVHGRSVAAKLEQVREIISLADRSFEATAEQYRALACREINQEDLKKYVKVIFKKEHIGLVPSIGKVSQAEVNFDKLMGDITRLFETGRGNQMPGVRGTYWAAYNAITEHMSYEAGRNEDRRLTNLWFGKAARMNQTALKTAVEMVAA
jgi:phage/plasmid-like protein (TIGR03299 family)